MMARHRQSASSLTKRASFLKPEKGRDPDGNIIQGYFEQFNVAASVQPLRGGEEIMQARMQSKAPAIITVRASSQSRQITSEWRIRIDGHEYDVKEDPRESQNRAFLEMLAEA